MEIDDEYNHIVEGIFYTPENIPSKLNESDDESVRIHKEFNSQNESCVCKGKCASNKCKCIIKIHSNIAMNYTKTQDGNVVLCHNLLFSDQPIYECNSECNCDVNCGNRLVQFGPRKMLKIITTDKKGLGITSIVNIPKGAFVCEYAGEVLTLSEAKARDQFNMRNCKMNYIICLNEYVGMKKIQTFIDPSTFGNVGRYLNHSCDPNCEIAPVRIDSPIPKLCLFANKDIISGDELTFDYAPSVTIGNIKNSIMKCFCGSTKCKGWLPAEEYDQ